MAGPVDGTRTGWPLDGWLGAVARIAAFVVLMVALSLVFGALWATLPLPDEGVWVFAGTIVTAAAALLAGVLMIRAADGRRATALGIAVSPMTGTHSAVGVGIGAAGLLAAVLAMMAGGALQYEAQDGTAAAWLAAVAVQGAVFTVAAFAEEVMFRGYAFQVLARSAGPAVATALSSALFAIAHGANPDVGAFALINIFLAGVLLAVAYIRTLSLWFVTALHMAWNWTMATLFDLPVSGIQLFDTPLYQPVIGGPDWWSGGVFGPEGGVVGTIGFAVATLLVLKLRSVRPDPAIVAAAPLLLDRTASGRHAPREGTAMEDGNGG